jgi:hypothetical protein
LTTKSNWKSQPQAMLVARATSEIARLIASDAILGIAYSIEEIADGVGAGVEVPAVTADPESTGAPGTRRMSRRAIQAAPVDEEPVDDEPEPHPLSDRVAAAVAAMKELDDLAKQDLRDYADGRSLAGGYLLEHEQWLDLVELWLAERSDPT